MSKVYAVKVSGSISTKISTGPSESSSLEYLPIHLDFVIDDGLRFEFLQETSTMMIKDDDKIAVIPTSVTYDEDVSLDLCAFKVYGQDAYSGSIGFQLIKDGEYYSGAEISNLVSDDTDLFYCWNEADGKSILFVTLEGEPRELTGTVYITYTIA